jgi:LPXTG-motif cell wall-anchored protein
VTTAPPTATGATTSPGKRAAAGQPSPSTLHIVDAAPASSDTHHGAGSPLALIVGGVAVLALAGSALIVVRRRRRLE